MSVALAAMYAMQFLSGVKSQRDSEKQQIEANKKRAKGYMQSMNYSFQNAEIQRQSLFASAVDDLTKTRMQAQRQVSAVANAVNEDNMGGGRTADMVVRSTQNDTARALRSIIENYRVKSNEIDLNKEATLISTKNAIDSIPSVQRKSTMSYILDATNAYMSYKGAVSGTNTSGRDSNLTGGTNTINYSFFSGDSLFNTNPVASYYSGIGYNGAFNYNYGGSGVSSTLRGGDNIWRTRLLVQ